MVGMCISGVCDVPNICNENGVQDGAETDVDCGGGVCPFCDLGARCLADRDCMSGACDGQGFCATMGCAAGQIFPIGTPNNYPFTDPVEAEVYKGNVYVSARWGAQVVKIRPDGTILDQLLPPGGFAACPQCTQLSHDISFDPDTGRIYIVDNGPDNVVVLNADKSFASRLGSSSGETYGGYFAAGSYYLVGHVADEINVYDTFGMLQGKIADVTKPTDVIVDQNLRIVVVDRNNDRLRVYDSGRNFLFNIGSAGTGDGQFTFPVGVAEDSSGNYFVSDMQANRVTEFTAAGAFVASFGSTGSGDGSLSRVRGIAIGDDDSIYTTEARTSEGGNARVQKFSSAFAHLATWAPRNSNEFNAPGAAILHSSGQYLVPDSTGGHIAMYDCNGVFVGTIGSLGSGAGNLNWPRDIEEAPNGHIYVTDLNNDRIAVFDAAGDFVKNIGSSGSGDGQFMQPFGIAVDSQGNFFVSDSQADRVSKFDSDGNFVLTFGQSGSGPTDLDLPRGIAVDASGNVYVADLFNHRVQKYDNEGVHLLTIGSAGFGDGKLSRPSSVAVGPGGDIYVGDTTSQIHRFDAQGNFKSRFGKVGMGYLTRGELGTAAGLSFDTAGDMLVADSQGNRVLRFARDGSPRPGAQIIDHAPVLKSVVGGSYAAGILFRVDVDNENDDDVDEDQDPIDYSCRYDTTVDGSVAVGANDCTSIANAEFFSGTGIIKWTPMAAQAGDYEMLVTGSDAGGNSDDTFFVITITP